MIDFTKFKKLTIGGMELKQLFINGIQVWKSGYKNWVKHAIDTDESIYQGGKGYIEGYRLSSGGGLSAQAGTITTGFIPCKPTDVIRLGGVSWYPPSGYCYLAFYDSSFAVLGSINCFPSTASVAVNGYHGVSRGICMFPDSVHPTIENGVVTFDNYAFSDGSKVAYFRVNGYGNGADAIVTVNEEIE